MMRSVLSDRRCYLLIGLSFLVDQASWRSHRTQGDRASYQARYRGTSAIYLWACILLSLVSYASPLSCSVREALSVVERLIDLPADPQVVQ
jgi:hypothetical protein